MLSDARSAPPLEIWKNDIKDYMDRGYLFVVIHNLIKENHPCSEITIRRYIHKNFPSVIKAVMIRTIEDAVMEVDFGYLGLTYDSLTNKNRKTWVFSARLRKSRKAYREIVYDQSQETFFNCRIHSFTSSCSSAPGGIPKPD